MRSGNGSNATADVKPTDVARNARSLAQDVFELAELQTELLKVDAKDWTKRIILPAILLCVGLVAALGCVPVLLFSLAEVLVEQFQLSRPLSLLIAGLVGLLIGIVCGIIGWKTMTGSVSVFSRSREELQRNIRWIRRVLHG